MMRWALTANIYVADYQLLRVQEFDLRCRLLATIGTHRATCYSRRRPIALPSTQGVLYATDGLSVVKFSRTGKLLARWR